MGKDCKIKKEIIERVDIKKMVREKGKTLVDVANYLGIHPTALSKYVNGHIQMPEKVYNQILKYLKIYDNKV